MGFLTRDENKFQKEKNASKNLPNKGVSKFQQNAARLEHSNVRNKNKSKKGN